MKDAIWTESFTFSGTTWQGERQLNFIPDTVSLQKGDACRGILTLRYNANAPVKKLPVVVDMECPSDGYYECDTLEFELLPMEMRTGNNGKIGVFETTDTIPLKIPPKPGWELSLRQTANNAGVSGLYSITFTLERENNN